jgi:hypothetical protein
MKRLAVVLGTCLLMVTVLATPVLGAAQKVALVPCASELASGCAPNSEPLGGGGFVVFNNSAGENNLVLTVALKKVTPETAYDIYLFVDQTATGTKLGTVMTNEVGNATFHMNTKVALGTHALGIDVVYENTGSDLYLSDNFYCNYPGSALCTPTLTFE